MKDRVEGMDAMSENYWKHGKLARKMGGARQNGLIELKMLKVVLLLLTLLGFSR